jgi:hypothetical protein
VTDSGTTLEDGLKVVTTAATRVRLTTVSEFAAKSVIIQALNTNEGIIVVGAVTVVAKAGSHATPEQRGIRLEKNQLISFDIVDPTQIWLDTDKSGDGVSYVVLRA